MSSCSVGEYGLMIGAARATSARIPMKTSASTIPRRARMFRSDSPRAPASEWSAIADSRIDQRRNDVREQAAERREHAGDDHAGDGDVVIQGLNGIDGQLAEPVPAENEFNEKGAA